MLLIQSSFLILGGDWEDDEDGDAGGVGTHPPLGGRLLARLLPRVQEQQELGHRWPVKDDGGQEGKAGARIQLTPGSFSSHPLHLLSQGGGWRSSVRHRRGHLHLALPPEEKRLSAGEAPGQELQLAPAEGGDLPWRPLHLPLCWHGTAWTLPGVWLKGDQLWTVRPRLLQVRDEAARGDGPWQPEGAVLLPDEV